MTISRVFVPLPLVVGQQLTLSVSVSQHLVRVLRLRLGDTVAVFNSQLPGEFSATIIATRDSQLIVSLDAFRECQRESPLIVNLGQGISRGDRMDFTIQKAVELGVCSITPLFTEYCNVKLDGERLRRRLEHWQKVAISAAEQSGRCLVPQVLAAKHLIEWLDSKHDPIKIALDPHADLGLRDLEESAGSITLLVGSEGGLSDHEMSAVKKSGFLTMTLGKRVLRTETAALAAISALQVKFGDF